MEVLLRVKEQRNILHEIRKRKANWIRHILRRNCLLNHVMEGRIEEGVEVMGRRRKRCKQLLNDLKETRRYGELEEEEIDRTFSRTGFGRGFTPVVSQTAVCNATPFHNFAKVTTFKSGPGSVVGIATSYGKDGPGIESR
jgi:hypothetical protein